MNVDWIDQVEVQATDPEQTVYAIRVDARVQFDQSVREDEALGLFLDRLEGRGDQSSIGDLLIEAEHLLGADSSTADGHPIATLLQGVEGELHADLMQTGSEERRR